MDRRFEVRRQEMLAECEVTSEVFEGVLVRMNQFIQPFADLLKRPEQRTHATDSLSGLVSDLKRKNIESIAYRLDQDRRSLLCFLGNTLLAAPSGTINLCSLNSPVRLVVSWAKKMR